MAGKADLWTRCVRKSSENECPGQGGGQRGEEILQPLGGDVVSVDEIPPPRGGVMQARKRG